MIQLKDINFSITPSQIEHKFFDHLLEHKIQDLGLDGVQQLSSSRANDFCDWFNKIRKDYGIGRTPSKSAFNYMVLRSKSSVDTYKDYIFIEGTYKEVSQ